MKQHYEIRFDNEKTVLALASGGERVPGAGEVLVQMKAASLNYRDLLTIDGAATRTGGVKDGLVPLSDGVGVIVALGEGVQSWQVGDRVSPNFFPDWLDGRFDPRYLGNALGGGSADGVLGQSLVLPAAALVRPAEHLSDAEAATLPCAGVTAWHALFERGAVQRGDIVLVQGTGGVALFGLQLAVAAGARVIVTSSSNDKLARARALGAWGLVNYRETPEWDQAVLAMTDGHGADFILELGGPDTYDRSIRAVAAGGRIAQIGVLSGFNARPDIQNLQFKNATIDGVCVGSAAHLRRLNAFLGEHKIHPVIDRVFEFDQAQQAYAHLRSASHFGKVVISL